MSSWREVNSEARRERQDLYAFRFLLKTPPVGAFNLPANGELGVRASGAIAANTVAATIGSRSIYVPAMTSGAIRNLGYFRKGSLVTIQPGFALVINAGLGRWKTLQPAVFNPVIVPQLVAAIASDYGVTNGGANVAGAYGTSRSLSVASGGTAPTVDALGINGQQALLLPGGSIKIQTFSTPIVFNGAFRIMWTSRADHTSGSKTVVGKDNNNAENIRIPVTDGVTNATIVARVALAAAFSAAIGRPISQGGHLYEVRRDDAGILTLYLDRELVGTQAGHGGVSTWDAFGYRAAGSDTFQGLIKDVLFLDESAGTISAEHYASLNTYLEDRGRSPVYVNFATGLDANDGSRADRAKKTFGHVLSLPNRPGTQIVVADDTIHDDDPIYTDTTSVPASATTTDRPWVIRRSGTGTARPLIRRRDVITGWSLVSGTIYKSTVALTVSTGDGENVMSGRVTNGATKTRLYTSPDNTPDLNQIFYDGTFLYINVGADPTGMTVEVATQGPLAIGLTNAAIRIARPYVTVDGIDVDLFPGNGIRLTNTSGWATIRNVTSTYAALDAYNFAGQGFLVEDCKGYYPGRRFDGQGSAGDIFTGHGPTTVTLRRCVGVGGGKGGIANEQACVMIAEDCSFTDCYLPVILLAQGTAGVGALSISNSDIGRPASAGQNDAILLQAGLPAGYTLTATNNRFEGFGPTRGRAINNLAGANATITQSGNTQNGFLSVAGGEVARNVPSGFGTTNGITIYQNDVGALVSDFNIDAQRPATNTDYYIDPVAGLNSNDGLTQATPKQDLSNAADAAALAGARPAFKLKPGVYRGARGPNGVAFSFAAFTIEPWATDPSDPANRVTFIRKSDTLSNVWVVDSGATYRRSTTTGADPVWVFDRSIRIRSIPASYPKASSLANCQATAGTWWRDSGTGNFYVHAADGRNLVGDTNIELSATGTNLNLIPTQSMTAWIQNVEFGCGDEPFVCNFTTNTGLTMDVYLKNVGTFGSRVGNGLSYDADLANCTLRIFQYRCWTAYNVKDGFNYHAQGSIVGTFWFEYECWTGFTGADSGLANNASTQHENCRGISLNCDFAGSQNRTVHDVTATKRWMLGTTIRASQGLDAGTAQTLVSGHPNGASNCTVWVDTCVIYDSPAGGLVAYGAADRIYYANMNIAGLTTGGAGQITAYAA